MTSPQSAHQRWLVYLLHAYKSSPEQIEPLRTKVAALFPNAHVCVPRLPMSVFSRADPNKISADIASEINDRYSPERFDGVILVGHSVGALIARKAYVIACGELARAPFENSLRAKLGVPPGQQFPGYDWAKAVDRIVLLAAMNRGWRVSHHISLWRAPIWSIGSFIGQLIHLVTRRRPLIMMVRRGAEFITNLRIQWIVLGNQQRASGLQGPLTVQLLGSRDDMVAPDDNIDLVSGSNFVYLDVPESKHATIVDVAGSGAPAGRWDVISQAMTGTASQLANLAVLPSDDHMTEPELNVQKVVFVVHGIRDAGYWTHKIARLVRKLGKQQGQVWATETSSYGYFPMAPFLTPLGRRKKVEWMMDQYAEALARYPVADFSYVGHSNGTYLLAKALQLYPACRFERVVFAGSVVRNGYPWQAAHQRGQVKSVLNFVGTADWVVAFFPGLFEYFRIQDLGNAGHKGFLGIGSTVPVNNRFVEGTHDAGIRESSWKDIANFLVTGNLNPSATLPQSRWISALGKYPVFVWITIALLLIWAWLPIGELSCRVLGPMGEGFILALYIGLILLILRRI